MNRFVSLVLPGFFAFTTAFAAGPVIVEPRIAFAEPAAVPPHVLSDCALEANLPRLIQDQAHGPLLIGDGDTRGRVFKGWIIEIADPGKSAWSGTKSLTIEGVLTEAGTKIGTVTVREQTGRGLADSCGALNFAARVAADKIARWLVNPVPGARLGDFN